mgnify:CR=1 FL=1
MRNFKLMTLAVAFAVLTVLSGCATTGGGQSDEESVAATVAAYTTAMEANNLEQMMAQVSEDFEGQDGIGKAELSDFLENAIDMGYLEGATLSNEDAETTIEGDTASIMGLYLEGDMGAMTLDMDLKKEADGTWRIVSMDAQS